MTLLVDANFIIVRAIIDYKNVKEKPVEERTVVMETASISITIKGTDTKLALFRKGHVINAELKDEQQNLIIEDQEQ